MKQRTRRITFAIWTMVALAGASLAAAPGPRWRKVQCGTPCAAGESVKTTKECIFDKELYKIDGKGCRDYRDVCWCGTPPPPVEDGLKL